MELIKLNTNTIGKEVKETVDARELYSFLEVKTAFKDWFSRRVEDFGFIEGRDFCSFLSETGGRPSKEYALAIDMAKELSMVERNEKGKQARLYFIECERRIKSPELQIANAILLAGRMIEEQKSIIADMSPKVEFYEAVTGSKDAIEIGLVAKVLNMGIGRNSLFEFLRNNSILQPNNIPYQKHIDAGYFRVIESSFQKPDGSTHVSFKTVVYQKGVDYIRKMLNGRKAA